MDERAVTSSTSSAPHHVPHRDDDAVHDGGADRTEPARHTRVRVETDYPGPNGHHGRNSRKHTGKKLTNC